MTADGADSPRGRYHRREVWGLRPYPFRGVPEERRTFPHYDTLVTCPVKSAGVGPRASPGELAAVVVVEAAGVVGAEFRNDSPHGADALLG